MHYTLLVLWAAFLVVAIFYTRSQRHPATRPLAAYLIFVTVFTVISFIVFAATILVLEAAGLAGLLADPIAAVLFIGAVFVPAFLVARWQLRKPPYRQRQP